MIFCVIVETVGCGGVLGNNNQVGQHIKISSKTRRYKEVVGKRIEQKRNFVCVAQIQKITRLKISCTLDGSSSLRD